MRIVESGPLRAPDREALGGGEQHPFGTEGLELQWRPKERHVRLRDSGGRPVEGGLARGALLGPAFALLFCREAVRGLYAKLGFAVVAPPVEVLQPEGT